MRVAAMFAVSLTACSSMIPNEDAQRLSEAMQRRPVVLLGEVHDNEAQHALRAAALRRMLERGARPAIAFEQFDREHQPAIDHARGEPLPAGADRVAHLIAQGQGAPSWNWALYRPYVELALQYKLPIVAANLSRADVRRVAQNGFGAVFDERTRSAAALDRLPEPFLAEHRRAIDEGHCQLMPQAALTAMAWTQIARDLALAQAIRPHIARGVVLLTGNGHARNDIGVPFFLTAAERERTLTIGLLESSDAGAAATLDFDVIMRTPPQPRDDPCAALRSRPPRPAG